MDSGPEKIDVADQSKKNILISFMRHYQKWVALCIVLLLGAGFGWFFLHPHPFTDYVPADSLGYFELPEIEKGLRLIHDSAFVSRAVGEARATAVQHWVDSTLDRFEIPVRRLSSMEFGVIVSTVTVERDQTLRLSGVLLVRAKSFLVHNLAIKPQSIAEKLSESNAFVSVESLHGQEIAVLTRLSPGGKIFIAVKRDAVLLSNDREALSSVLSVMEGKEPAITASTSWRESAPRFFQDSLVRGFVAGPATLNLVRDFLVKNFSPFEDAARTSRFLSALGFDQLRSITYNAQTLPGGLQETWEYRLNSAAGFSQPFLSQFIHQPGLGLDAFPVQAFPSNTVDARVISIAKSGELWNTLADGLGILTQQDAPRNRDLLIGMFEGGLGFRIQQDLLAHLGDSIAILELSPASGKNSTPNRESVEPQKEGWIFAFKIKDRPQLEATFSKIVAEERKPQKVVVGSTPVYSSDLGHKGSSPLSGNAHGLSAYAVKGDVLYFSTDRDTLMAAIQALEQPRGPFLPQLPRGFDSHAPYFSFTLPLANTRVNQDSRLSEDPLNSSVSRLFPTPDGFTFERSSAGGFLCEIILQNLHSVD